MATTKTSKWSKRLGIGAVLTGIALFGYWTCDIYQDLQEQRRDVIDNIDSIGEEQLTFCEKTYEVDTKTCNERYTSEMILECYRKSLLSDPDRCEKNKQCRDDAVQRYHRCRWGVLKSTSIRLYGVDCIDKICSK